jgi:pilus assembly protein Flp/PilA
MIYLWSWAQTLGTQLRRDERGATMVEYGLLVALIAILLIGAILVLTGALDGLFRDAADEVSNPGPIPGG